MNTFAELHTEDQAKSMVEGLENMWDQGSKEFVSVLKVDSDLGDTYRASRNEIQKYSEMSTHGEVWGIGRRKQLHLWEAIFSIKRLESSRT